MTNGIGVPQGAVLSPMLFNLAMAGLPTRLAENEGMGFTIYADDITLWTSGGPPGAQEQTLQDGLNTVADYLRQVGMAPSPEKTTYVVVADASNRKKGVKNLFNLCLEGRPIQCQHSIRVLGLPIHGDGGASTWLTKVTKTWRQTLGLIRRATSKSLVHALLMSEAMYGINYLRVTGAQKRKLEVLCREAIRLERTRPGRAILQLLGYQLMGSLTISPPPPPWEDEAVVDHRPMKQNVDKDQKGRRNNAAKKHAESVQDASPGSETVHVRLHRRSCKRRRRRHSHYMVLF
ncbi:hypothetical protein HPB47_012581 [Ixodes persulcatus]|uniref:Uncharacterized protein n=1 Tax=Ixodes persulcatus TaxID=34615 RepID=A0AC60NT50_IXOPE|nr:hypothetical protein HPB47_012581 [Ixodes persulcatus]